MLRLSVQGEDISAEELYNLQRKDASRIVLVDTRSKPEQDVSIIPGIYKSAGALECLSTHVFCMAQVCLMFARANPGAVTVSQFEDRKAELLNSKVIVAYW